MTEPLTTELLSGLLPKLLTAFPSKMSSQNPAYLAEVYRNGLRGLNGDAVRAAVDISIQHDSYFPKVARLRELAGEWTRRNRVTVAARFEAAWNVCAVCGAHAKQREITRAVRPDGYYHQPISRNGPAPTLETVMSGGMYMDHDPRAHHVHDNPEGTP